MHIHVPGFFKQTWPPPRQIASLLVQRRSCKVASNNTRAFITEFKPDQQDDIPGRRIEVGGQGLTRWVVL
jgi:hypothetical protein